MTTTRSFDTIAMAEPTQNRCQDKGKNQSLKLSIVKQVPFDDPENADMARAMLDILQIQGKCYCRRHIMTRCHICELTYEHINDEVDTERMDLGLRESGDPRLNEFAERWGDYIQEKQMELRLSQDITLQMEGKDYYKNNPDKWLALKQSRKQEEREINDRFFSELTELRAQGTSQCCYWNCQTPDEAKFRCSGCKMVKYCSKECQQKDWKWEHKGECDGRVPQFLKEEYEQELQRNLAGDYRHRDEFLDR